MSLYIEIPLGEGRRLHLVCRPRGSRPFLISIVWGDGDYKERVAFSIDSKDAERIRSFLSSALKAFDEDRTPTDKPK